MMEGEVDSNTADKDDDYQRLRSLLLGKDYEAVIQQEMTQENIDRVAEVLSEAFNRRNLQDNSLAKEMSPVIEDSIDTSIKAHPERITNVIFPIIGPAVRKAVSNALSELMHSLNVMLTETLTLKSLFWRIKAWRLGMPYSQYFLLQLIHYQVEQAFLIHRESGVLIQSAVADGVAHHDPELVSSMLAAITDFASDSFDEQPDSLSVLKFGDLSLLLETGPNAILAFAVRGVIQNDLKEHLSDLLEKIHKQYHSDFLMFNGDITPFEPVAELLQQSLLKKEKKKSVSRPWLAITAITLLLAFACYYIYQQWSLKIAIDKTIQQVNQQDGYQVLSDRYQNKELHLDILKSPLAIPTNELAISIKPMQFKLIFNQKLASLDDPKLYIPYLAQRYEANLSLVEGVAAKKPVDIVLSGVISRDNIDQLENDSLVKDYFTIVLDDELKITEQESIQEQSRKEIETLVKDINSRYFFFEKASALMEETSRQTLNTTIAHIRKILQLQKAADISVKQISISGYADQQGGDVINRSLSAERAQLIQDILNSNGITEELTISWGYGAKDLETVPSVLQRRARIEVLYMPN